MLHKDLQRAKEEEEAARGGLERLNRSSDSESDYDQNLTHKLRRAPSYQSFYDAEVIPAMDLHLADEKGENEEFASTVEKFFALYYAPEILTR